MPASIYGPYNFKKINVELTSRLLYNFNMRASYSGFHGAYQMFAPWQYTEVVCLYPFVFDLRSPSAGPGNLSTVMMQHFVSYIRGAHGLDGVAP